MDIENHIPKTLFQCSAAAWHHDPNQSALEPMATHSSITHTLQCMNVNNMHTVNHLKLL